MLGGSPSYLTHSLFPQTQLHYDPSSEWVAHLPEASDAQHAGKQAAGDDAPAVIYLSPAKAKGGSGGREPRPLGCAPLGPHGAVLCDEGIRLRDHDAALLVVASGERGGASRALRDRACTAKHSHGACGEWRGISFGHTAR